MPRSRFARAGSAAVLAAVAALGLGLASTFEEAAAEAEVGDTGETVTTELQPGVNLAGWTEPEAGVEAIPQIERVYAWDAATQIFRGAARDGGGLRGDLETLAPGYGALARHWRRGAARVDTTVLRAERPRATAAGPEPRGLRRADHMPVGAAIAELNGIFVAGWAWDAVAQRYRHYRADDPDRDGVAFPTERSTSGWKRGSTNSCSTRRIAGSAGMPTTADSRGAVSRSRRSPPAVPIART